MNENLITITVSYSSILFFSVGYVLMMLGSVYKKLFNVAVDAPDSDERPLEITSYLISGYASYLCGFILIIISIIKLF